MLPAPGWVVTLLLFEYTVRKNVQLLFHNGVLSESKKRFLRVFSSFPRKLYTIFQFTFLPNLMMQGYPHKASKLLTFSTDSVTKFLVGTIEPEL